MERKFRKDSLKNKLLQEKFVLIYICIFFIVIKSILFLKGQVFFDEGVYVGIAKYFLSWGKIGYFEPIRPLLLPFLLSPFQLLPWDSLIMGRIFSLVLSILSIFVVYFVARKSFGKKEGLWTAAFFSTSTLILLYGGLILTDVPAYVLALLGTGFIVSRHYKAAGIALGAGFLFKFPVLVIIPIISVYIIWRERKKFAFPLIYFFLSFFITLLPYLLFNLLYYQELPIGERIITPLVEASTILQNGLGFYHPASLFSYLSTFFLSGVALSFFFLLAIFNFYRRKTWIPPAILYLACACSFLFYFSFGVPRYDFRYLLSLVPFLSVLAGTWITSFSKSKKKYFCWLASGLIIIQIVVIALVSLSEPKFKHDSLIENLIEEYDNPLLITNSAFPLFYSKSKVALRPGWNLGDTYLFYRMRPEARWLVIDLDGYPCPSGDSSCRSSFQQRIARILSRNNIISCSYLHGSKIIILTKDQGYISKTDCLQKLGYEEISSAKVKVLVRFNAAVLYENGELKNKEMVSALINKLKGKGISRILVLAATNIPPNQKTKDFLRALPSDVTIGVMPIEGISTREFMLEIENLSHRKVELLVPPDDVLVDKALTIPEGIKYCLVAPWELPLTQLPYKKMDLYTVKNWETMELYDDDYLKFWFEALYDSDNEIIIDIPVDALNKENYNKFNRFLDYISGVFTRNLEAEE